MKTIPVTMRIAIEGTTLEELDVPETTSKAALDGLYEIKHDEHAGAIRDAIVAAMSALQVKGLAIVGSFTIGKVTKTFAGTD